MQKNDYSVELDITGDALKRWAIFFVVQKKLPIKLKGARHKYIKHTYMCIYMIYNTHIIF